MTDDEATKVLTILQAAFPHPPLTKDRLTLYLTKLRPLDFRAATKAVDRLTDDLGFFPTVAQLKAAITTAGGLAPMLPSGNGPGLKPKAIYQVFDLDADDYVSLPQPIPETEPRYAGMMAASRALVREAGRRDRGEVDPE